MANVLYSVLNASAITAVMVLIIFVLFGSGGGFGAIYNLGKFAATVPAWVWGVIAGAWILSAMRN